jgi:hypothetical protein
MIGDVVFTHSPSSHKRELLALFLGMAVVRLDVNRAFEEERFVQTWHRIRR